MLKVKTLMGQEIPYKNKNGEDRVLYNMWFCFEGDPISYKLAFFRSEQITKAKAYVQAGSAQLNIVPDRNMQPVFELV